MQPRKDELSFNEEAAKPNEDKLPFRIGLNEGIIVRRESLSKIDLYTDGLTGCVVLAASNTGHVFMAHIETNNNNDDNNNVRKYLMSICAWMKEHDGGQIEFYLGGNRDTSNNFIMFEQELNKISKPGEISVNTISTSDAYRVELSKDVVILTSQTQKYSPQDILGSIYGEEYIVDRVDAKDIWIERSIYAGDSNEYDLLTKYWGSSSALRRAVRNLVFSVSPAGYTKDLLMIADKKIAGRNVTDEDRIKICNSLSHIMQEMNKKTRNDGSKNELDAELGKYMGVPPVIISGGNLEITSASSSTSDDSKIEEQIDKIVKEILVKGSPPMNPAKKLRPDEEGDEKKKEKEEKEEDKKKKYEDAVTWQSGNDRPSLLQSSSEGANGSRSTADSTKTLQTKSSAESNGTAPSQKEKQSAEAMSFQFMHTVEETGATKKPDISETASNEIRQKSPSVPVKKQIWMEIAEVQPEKQVVEENRIESSSKI